MKTIALITLVGLAFFTTVATAQQSGSGNGNQGNFRHTQHGNSTCGACPMKSKMTNQGMKGMGQGMSGATTSGTPNGNGQGNPSYQGQGNSTATTDK